LATVPARLAWLHMVAPDPVGNLRNQVSASRSSDATESMQNLAYVVSSANENIQALQRTVKQQEKELEASREHAAALQRNYETLARIRRADQEEFLMLKSQQTDERDQIKQLQASLAEQREECGNLGRQLQAAAAAQAEAQTLQLQLEDASRARDELSTEVERLRVANGELHETNKMLKVNIDKLSRAQQEMLTKARKADDSLRALQTDKETAEKAQASLSSKSSVQERQLKTFLQANEALEADLRKQLSRVAQLERRKQEQEAEQQTIEAYYQARLEEMQAQYDRLLSEIDDAKRSAQANVYRSFHDDAQVVPAGGGGSSSPPPPGRVRPSPSKP